MSTPEQTVTARIMQDIKLQTGLHIHKGAVVIGQLVKGVPGSENSPAEIILTFNELRLLKT